MQKNFRKTLAMKVIENSTQKNIEDYMYELYVEKNLSVEDICDIMNISKKTFRDWLDRFGIYSRSLREYKS